MCTVPDHPAAGLMVISDRLCICRGPSFCTGICTLSSKGKCSFRIRPSIAISPSIWTFPCITDPNSLWVSLCDPNPNSLWVFLCDPIPLAPKADPSSRTANSNS